LNAAAEGRAYRQVAFAVEPERVARFAAAVGDDAFVPPTFATVLEIAAGLGQAIADEDLGLDLSRVLHGEQEYEWHRPIRVGETLTAETTIANIRGRGEVEFLTLTTRIVDADGEPVVQARSTLVVRGDSA
jgi:hypothetical protein